MKQVTMLIVLDGFGYRKETKYNAIAQANTPNLDQWLKEYPHTLLDATGKAVGLPEGYIGSSETGHKTIGAGRRVREPLAKINDDIDNGEFFKQQILRDALCHLAESGKTLHIMGLLSNAGVHSEIKHLEAFLKVAKECKVQKVVIHPFLDGRDVAPKSAEKFLSELEKMLKKIGIGVIGTIHGRFYAMDRDNNWDRTKLSYEALTQEQSKKFSSWQQAIKHFYENNITDEYIPPLQLADGIIHNGDGVVFFNFRSDRGRQLTAAFVDPKFSHFPTKKLSLLFFITPTQYDPRLNTLVLYPPEKIENTLKEVLAQNGKSIFSIAETEKYAHVTYFFNGGKEATLLNETRHLISSNTHGDYATHPEMQAGNITHTVLNSLQQNPADFYLINYANADMVGHTGNMQATIKAIEYLDQQLGLLYKQVVEKMNGTIYITADHGNAEKMFDEETNQPKTSHTRNPVPFIMINKEVKNSTMKLNLKELSDIAPFILKQMGLAVPDEMKR